MKEERKDEKMVRQSGIMAERIKAAFNAAFYKGDGPAGVASTARLNLSARSQTGLRWLKRIMGTGNWFSDMYL